QRMAGDLVSRSHCPAQEVLLALGVARARKQLRRHAELGEQIEQARHRGAVDQIAGLLILEPVALEVAIDRVEIAGEHGVAHALARRPPSVRTAVRTASAMKSTCRSV